MRTAAVAFALLGLFASPLAAQGRGRANSQGIPPGHLPPAGACRVWYEGTPPGRQPAPTSCREAERIAARSRNARVIYGSGGSSGRVNPPIFRDDDGRNRPRAIPRPGTGQFPRNGGYRYASVAFDHGYNDGLDKGREDARDDDRYDPDRHSRYRSADRGYEGRYGSKDEYREIYRDGFRRGYDEAYRAEGRYDSQRRRNGSGWPWPF